MANHFAPTQNKNDLSSVCLIVVWCSYHRALSIMVVLSIYPWDLSNNAEVVKDDKVSSHRWIILEVNY